MRRKRAATKNNYDFFAFYVVALEMMSTRRNTYAAITVGVHVNCSAERNRKMCTFIVAQMSQIWIVICRRSQATKWAMTRLRVNNNFLFRF